MAKVPFLQRGVQLLAFDRIAGLADQALFSAATLLQIYVYAKVLKPEDFGVFGLVQGNCLLLQGLQRSATILPMIITAGPNGGDAAWGRVDLIFRAIMAVTLGLLALAAGSLGLGPTWTRAFTLSALCTLTTLAYEFQRRCLFLQRQSKAVLIAASIYFLMTCASVAIIATKLPTVEAAAMGLFLASAVTTVVAWRSRSPVPPEAIKVRDHLGIMGWNIAAFLPYAVYNNGMVLIVGAVAGVKAVALFTASRLFTAPIQTLIQAIDSVDKPRARRMFAADGQRGLSLSINKTRKTLLLLGLPYLIVVFLGADLLVQHLFGNRFPGMTEATRAWCTVALLMLLSQPLETGLLVLRKSHLFFWTRGASAIAALVVLVKLVVPWPQTAPMIALVVGWSSGGLLAWAMLRRSLAKGDI